MTRLKIKAILIGEIEKGCDEIIESGSEGYIQNTVYFVEKKLASCRT